MSEWINLAKTRLSSEDSIERNFYASFGRTAGILVMSKEKLLFLEEKGFLKKTHNLLLELPFGKIREIAVVGTGLKITDSEGKGYVFTTQLDASMVEEHLRGLMPVPGSTS